MIAVTLYIIMSLYIEDWRNDQYRWENRGVHNIPKKSPTLRKSYFEIDTPNGCLSTFKKHAYQLLPAADASNPVTLIQYFGNENVAVEFSHGNSKDKESNFVRTMPSVLERLETRCGNEKPSAVYKSEVTKMSSFSHVLTMQPRNTKQVKNFRHKVLKNKKITHDGLTI